MTREEAIKYGIEWLKDECLDAKDRAFIKIALEALEQEPCDVSGTDVGKTDAISRQAAIDAIRKDVMGGLNYEGILTRLPSVTPKQRTGHWEWVQYDYSPKLGNWHCSECRCVVVECVNKEEEGGIPLYKYCPQCGAKIQEVEK